MPGCSAPPLGLRDSSAEVRYVLDSVGSEHFLRVYGWSAIGKLTSGSPVIHSENMASLMDEERPVERLRYPKVSRALPLLRGALLPVSVGSTVRPEARFEL